MEYDNFLCPALGSLWIWDTEEKPDLGLFLEAAALFLYVQDQERIYNRISQVHPARVKRLIFCHSCLIASFTPSFLHILFWESFLGYFKQHISKLNTGNAVLCDQGWSVSWVRWCTMMEVVMLVCGYSIVCGGSVLSGGWNYLILGI